MLHPHVLLLFFGPYIDDAGSPGAVRGNAVRRRRLFQASASSGKSRSASTPKAWLRRFCVLVRGDRFPASSSEIVTVDTFDRSERLSCVTPSKARYTFNFELFFLMPILSMLRLLKLCYWVIVSPNAALCRGFLPTISRCYAFRDCLYSGGLRTKIQLRGGVLYIKNGPAKGHWRSINCYKWV